MREHSQQTRTRLRDQRFDRGRPRRPDRGDNSTTCGKDVEIPGAGHLHLELVGAVTCPDDMCVWVHKARHEHTAICIEHRLATISGAEFVRCADRDDSFIAKDHCAVFDNTECSKGFSALRSTGECEKLRARVDEHGLFENWRIWIDSI